MPNINLLPEDLRGKEKKEFDKTAKRPKVFDIELNSPVAEMKPNLNSDLPKKTFWQRIFGDTDKSSKKPKADKFMAGSPNSAYSEKAMPKEKIEFKEPKLSGSIKTEPGVKPGDSIFGQSRFPIKEKNGAGKESFKVPNFISKEYQDKQSAAPKPKKIKKDSWTTSFFKPKKSNPIFGSKVDVLKTVIGSANQSPENSNNRATVITNSFKPAENNNHKKEEKIKNKDKKAKTDKAIAFDINLLPQELTLIRTFSLKAQVFVLILSIVISVGVITGAFFLLKTFQDMADYEMAIKVSEIKRQQSAYEINIKRYEGSLSLAKKLVTLDSLLKERVKWTKFFTLLEAYTLKTVYYTNFSADTSGTLSLPAQADSYDTAAKQIVLLKDNAPDFVKEVKVESIQVSSSEKQGITGVTFELKVKLADNVFKEIIVKGN